MAAWINIVDDDDEHFCLPTTPRLIGCDDVELGKPYNLTVLHSYNCTLCHTVALLHIYIPINTFALSNYHTITAFLHLQPHSFTEKIQIEQE